MVEIREIGILKRYEITCPHCNSVLSFNKLDEKSEYNSDIPFTDWYITCANCKSEVPTRSLTDKNYYDWRKPIE